LQPHEKNAKAIVLFFHRLQSETSRSPNFIVEFENFVVLNNIMLYSSHEKPETISG